jgi:LysR family hydrogen peroxide-inducible transcriptional activator
MNLRDLRYLVAVADLRSFSQAAEQCFVSQPTLSNQIRKLEEHLGVTLFERTNKRVMPTETGTRIIEAARRVLRDVETITDLAALAQDPLAGPFRLAAFPTLATYIFPKIVPAVKAAMPRLKLILIEEKTDEIVSLLKAGKIDAALLALPVSEGDLVAEKLFDDRFFLAVPAHHPLSDAASIAEDELKRHRLLLLEEGHCLRDQALAACRRMGAEEEQDFRATSLETLRLMVKAGSGITFIPEIALNDDPDIRYIPFTGEGPERHIALVWRKTMPRTAAIERLLDVLKALPTRGAEAA